MISLIVAMAKNRVIGKDQQMPWHLPADLAHFKKVTMNKPIIMGRKTFESIGRPLPGRRNIVITRQSIEIPGCDVCHSLEEALEAVAGEDEAMIIGGGNLYRQALSMAKRLYLTFIDLEVDGDTTFPEWNPSEWKEVSKTVHQPDQKNLYSYQFVTLEKIL
ncbi:MAG: type 3 dihydrofolate reductase [Coxiellaceae bacterium]|nr:type 3 dihydrofolate reductase [Coxiellaceae bacterium]